MLLSKKNQESSLFTSVVQTTLIPKKFNYILYMIADYVKRVSIILQKKAIFSLEIR